MPPRKRAASAPKDETEQELQTPETETAAEGQQAELEAAPAGDSTEPAPAGDGGDQDAADEPERSELREAEMPCGECFPNGWPEGAFSVGCIHGTYVRKQD
jgi:hypothetical protein